MIYDMGIRSKWRCGDLKYLCVGWIFRVQPAPTHWNPVSFVLHRFTIRASSSLINSSRYQNFKYSKAILILIRGKMRLIITSATVAFLAGAFVTADECKCVSNIHCCILFLDDKRAASLTRLDALGSMLANGIRLEFT
jgi:hypothetical protein